MIAIPATQRGESLCSFGPVAAARWAEFANSFHAVTGLRSTWQASTSPGRPTSAGALCRVVQQGAAGCQACLKVQKETLSSAWEKPSTVICHAGLTETAVPVRKEGRTVGFLLTGQVSLHRLRASRFTAKVGAADAAGEEASAVAQTKVMSWAKYKENVRLLQLFAQQLSPLLTVTQPVLPAMLANSVAQVRTLIHKCYSDSLTLEEMAKAAHLSVFHFARRFKAETGISPLQYLARTRVEAAKSLLLDRAQVAEIAFAVGFQSVSQFNRTFRSVAGQSPTEFRSAQSTAVAA